MKPILCMFGIHKGKNIDGGGPAGEWFCERCGKVLHEAIQWPRSPATCEEIMQPVNDVLEPARIVYCEDCEFMATYFLHSDCLCGVIKSSSFVTRYDYHPKCVAVNIDGKCKYFKAKVK